MGEKWPVSQLTLPTILLPPPQSSCSGRQTGPLSTAETRLRGQHGPLDISCDNTGGSVTARGVECWRKNRLREMRSKELAVRKDWKARIMGSACRSSVWKGFLPWVVKSMWFLLPAETPNVPASLRCSEFQRVWLLHDVMGSPVAIIVF